MITKIRFRTTTDGHNYHNRYLYSFKHLDTLDVTNTIKKVINEEVEDIITKEKMPRCLTQDGFDILDEIKKQLNNTYNAEIVVEDMESIPADIQYSIEIVYSRQFFLGAYLRIEKRKKLKFNHYYCEELRTVAIIKLYETDFEE